MKNVFMKIVFVSSSEFTLPLCQEIYNKRGVSIVEIFKSQYSDLLKDNEIVDILPSSWKKKGLVEQNLQKFIDSNVDPIIQFQGIISQQEKLNRNKLVENPVLNWARKNEVKFIAPEKINDSKEELILNFEIDAAILASYGQLISDEILQIPKYGFINWHPSLLPKYRGASPMQSTILNHEKFTALSWLEMIKKMDAGNIWLQLIVGLDEKADINKLTEMMIELSIKTWSLPIMFKIINQL